MTYPKEVKESQTIGLPSTHANCESFFQLRTLELDTKRPGLAGWLIQPF